MLCVCKYRAVMICGRFDKKYTGVNKNRCAILQTLFPWGLRDKAKTININAISNILSTPGHEVVRLFAR